MPRPDVPFLLELDNCEVGMAWLAIAEPIPGPAKWPQIVREPAKRLTPKQRNQGLEAVLIDRLIEEARKDGLAFLSVHPSPRSFPFYRRIGFTGDGGLLFLDLDA